jgi:transcriptional regulator with XRE-family HTH domain
MPATLAAKIAPTQRREILTVHNQIFFTNILRLLDERGMTKNELAERAGISVSFLSDLTNGKANPSLKIMESLAGALETPLTTLLETTDLSTQDLEALAGSKPVTGLPAGFVRVTAVLTEFQAFNVHQWNQANMKAIAEKAAKKS